MTAHLLIHGGWIWFWHGGRPPALGMILLCVVSMLLAFWIGGHTAAAILDRPADWLTGQAEGVRLAALLATIGGTTVVVSVMWLRQYLAALRLQTQLEQARADAAARLADDAQLRMLRAQLEPHMLFNTLATLRALIDIDRQAAQVMLDDLAASLRITLDASREDEVSLEKEFSLLESYLRLMSIRMGPRLAYRLSLPEDLRHCRVPPMLVQPIVENAIRHGLEPLPVGGCVDISAECHDGEIHIRVRDTGEGFAPGKLSSHDSDAHHAGFGLDAVRARLRSAYGDQAMLDIHSPGPGETCVTLRLPLHHFATEPRS